MSKKEMNLLQLRKITQTCKDMFEESLKQSNFNPAIKDKVEHVKNVALILKEMGIQEDFAEALGWSHDIGRVLQYSIFKRFADDIVMHHYLGEDVLARLILNGKLESSYELDIIRAVVSYHGRSNVIFGTLPKETLDIISLVSRADAIENGCIGAVYYLVREKVTDAKAYAANDPYRDQKSVLPEVKAFFEKGEKFDKIKYCKTYADYFLFAAVLAIQGLKGKDREIAKKAMKSTGALHEYEKIFKEHIENGEYFFEVLKSYYEN